MSEEQKKSTRLLAYWLFGTVVIVFGALTAYISFVGRMAGVVTPFQAIKAGFPIWGITALVAIIIYAGYYYYATRKG